ncbi:MAG: polyprenol monophosphomannose synthase [Bacteroidales bacterium]|nr:polyprenol monophosphomannose synthase [Bacteroidales bacterium]MCF8333255.1 polyprenol monophosphomannose synthase [Bacteroidales bacterium]
MSEGLVIIPTYNERENITKVLQKIFSLSVVFDVLIIDDGSPDGTARLVKDHMVSYPNRLFLIEREGKQGLGTAYIKGFRWALEHDYEYVFEMDADLSHDPDDLVRLYNTAREGYDLVIGSRYVKGVNVVNWPIGRVLMSYFASIYVKIVLGIKIDDTTAGFKCYHRNVLEAIDFNNIRFIGYAFQIEMKYTAWRLGFRLKEIPIIFTDRTEGESKMSKGIFKEAVWGVLFLRFRKFKQK